MKTEELITFRKFGPGYFILEQKETRNWTHELLARKMQMSNNELDGLLNNMNPLTGDIAQVLSDLFKTSAEYWINIDNGYRTWLSQREI